MVGFPAPSRGQIALNFKRPRPRPPKARPAYEVVPAAERSAIADAARYVGSPHHTDIPKFQLESHPREGATTIEKAEAAGLKNPTCTLCPRKWAHRHREVLALLQTAIRTGNYAASEGDGMPSRVWARDPDDPELVYEARLRSSPDGYKAYPLTTFQARYNLPVEVR
jgi:hypothetical protein